MIEELPMGQVVPNPDQPRRHFDGGKLAELAASIAADGLLQPVVVRPLANGSYMIVCGERRWRAHRLLGRPSIRAEIRAMDDGEMAICAIAENLQRADISPLEEARAFQRLLDRGHSAEALAARLGLKQPWRITERTQLLRLQETYQALLTAGQITPSQAFEMSRLSPAGQDRLFQLIRVGRCPGYQQLRAAAMGLLEAEQQGEIFADSRPTAADVQRLSRLEALVANVCAILRRGFDENDIVIAKKVDPAEAARLADELRLIQRHLAQLESALRHSAALV